ncbi:UbiA family prenyltransferase [Halorubellus sp. JP-L1]|uniref:UbiA family prenyltransferase n=1 Tax=Halorubellus sp. JP-L1 TaxID=2715753 RepID=UPI00140BB1FC|nr:UbiA family prenyltransferase [Halorubellus sp. JP-L1]NHN41003.1 UbiA family prenyltransferase [Halorubellus sp. JP-L1]
MSSARERVQQVGPTLDLPTVESVGRALVHASVVDAAVGAAKVLTVVLLLEIPLTPAVAVGGLSTFAIYASNKLVDDEDAVNAPERAQFVARYRRELTVATAGAVALALALSATAGPLAFALTALPGVAAVAYSVDLPLVERRLKDVLGVSTLLVAGSWALPVVALPVVWVDATFTATAGITFAFYLAQTAVAFEVRNVRDVAGDRAEGVDTVPVVFGVPTTRRLLYAVDVAAIGLYAAGTAAGVLPVAVGAVFAFATVVSIGVTASVDRGYDDARICLLRDANYGLVLLVVALAG